MRNSSVDAHHMSTFESDEHLQAREVEGCRPLFSTEKDRSAMSPAHAPSRASPMTELRENFVDGLLRSAAILALPGFPDLILAKGQISGGRVDTCTPTRPLPLSH
jgi:hypothetical protein